jgi:hypothetical protein
MLQVDSQTPTVFSKIIEMEQHFYKTNRTILNLHKMKKYAVLTTLLVCFFTHTNAQNLENIGKEKPVKLSGGLNIGTVFYGAQNLPEKQYPFLWSIGGSATLDVYGVSLPFSLAYTKSNASFSQPFVRFGVSPQYKWAKAHLGYRSLAFNQFVFSGQPIYGVGLELNPKKFRFGVMYGRLNKADFIDSTREQFRQQGSTFERKGFAVKLGLGSATNYVDFTFLKAKDDATSVDYYSKQSQSRPAENAALGITTRFQLGKHVSWTLDVAGSVYNRDITSRRLADFIDSNKLDPYKSYLDLVEKIIPLQASSQFVSAGETGLNFQFKPLSIGLKYRRVDPEYKAMGIFYIQNDLEQYTVNPNLRLFKNRVIVSGSVGLQKNNLDGKRLYRSERFIGQGNLNIMPSSKWALGFNYSNFGVTQQKQYVDGMYRDSLALRQVNQQFGITSSHNFLNPKSPQTLVFSVNLQNTDDYRQLKTTSAVAKSWFATASHSVFWTGSGVSLQTSLLANSNQFADVPTDHFYSLQFTASKTAFQQKLNLQGGGGYSIRQSDGTNTPSISLRFGSTLTVSQHHSFNALLQWVNTTTVGLPAYSEFYGSVGYGYSF